MDMLLPTAAYRVRSPRVETLSSPHSHSGKRPSSRTGGGASKPSRTQGKVRVASLDLGQDALGLDSYLNSDLFSDLGSVDYAHSLGSPERDYLRPYSTPTSPGSSSQSSVSSSPPPQAVTFSICPQCNTTEHHFVAPSRVCGRCGHRRFLNQDSASRATATMSQPSRTYWRPTRFSSSIVYAHVREGLEDMDDPIHRMLADWAGFNRAYLLGLAANVYQQATGPAMQAYYMELQAPSSMQAVLPGTPPQLSVANHALSSVTNLEVDDLLGAFAVLREEDMGLKTRGGRGIVIIVLTFQGAGIALACRLDEGTI